MIPGQRLPILLTGCCRPLLLKKQACAAPLGGSAPRPGGRSTGRRHHYTFTLKETTYRKSRRPGLLVLHPQVKLGLLMRLARVLLILFLGWYRLTWQQSIRKIAPRSFSEFHVTGCTAQVARTAGGVLIGSLQRSRALGPLSFKLKANGVDAAMPYLAAVGICDQPLPKPADSKISHNKSHLSTPLHHREHVTLLLVRSNLRCKIKERN